MVSFKVDAQARVEGDESLERHPIVAKVLGAGEDGTLFVKVAGDGRSPVHARVSGDVESPVSVAPLKVFVIPDLESLASSPLGSLLSSLAEGIRVEVSGSTTPIKLSLDKIPVDLNISVRSPANDKVFELEIKGSVGQS